MVSLNTIESAPSVFVLGFKSNKDNMLLLASARNDGLCTELTIKQSASMKKF
jgi:hypothetical protein